jgi:hypothetical protein
MRPGTFFLFALLSMPTSPALGTKCMLKIECASDANDSTCAAGSILGIKVSEFEVTFIVVSES